ncbi:hypothetical protein ACP4OV_002746 [Aristida adscensionis]
MALSFHPTTAPPLLGRRPAPDMSFLQDVHPEVTDALLGFVYDPLDPTNAAIDDFLGPIPDASGGGGGGFLGHLHAVGGEADRHCDKKPRACHGDPAWRGLVDSTDPGRELSGGAGGNRQVPLPLPKLPADFVLPPLPPPLPEPVVFVRSADANTAAGNNGSPSVQSSAARERRKRISEKTAQLARLIPGGHKLNTAEMLQEAGRHVKLLQAQAGMLALMHTVGPSEKEKTPTMVQEQLHALIVSAGVQERLAAEGKCLVPRKLVDAVAGDDAVRANAKVSRDLRRFMASLGQ